MGEQIEITQYEKRTSIQDQREYRSCSLEGWYPNPNIICHLAICASLYSQKKERINIRKLSYVIIFWFDWGT